MPITTPASVFATGRRRVALCRNPRVRSCQDQADDDERLLHRSPVTRHASASPARKYLDDRDCIIIAGRFTVHGARRGRGLGDPGHRAGRRRGKPGFLIGNRSPARVFLGDVGSESLRFALAGSGSQRCSSAVTLPRRLARRERVYVAHRGNAYRWQARRWNCLLRVTVACWLINLLWLVRCAWLCIESPARGRLWLRPHGNPLGRQVLPACVVDSRRPLGRQTSTIFCVKAIPPRIFLALGVRKRQFVTHNHMAERGFTQDEGDEATSWPFGATDRLAGLTSRQRMKSA